MPKKKTVKEITATQQTEAITRAIALQAARVDQNIYDGRLMIPADNVDADGKSWPTVGENIRFGEKITSNMTMLKNISNLLGVDVIYETTNVIIAPNTPIVTDNPNFGTTKNRLYYKSGSIVAFFILNTSINSDEQVVVMTVSSSNSTMLTIRNSSSAALNGNVTIGALVTK